MFIGYVFSDRSELNRGNFESKTKNEIEEGEFRTGAAWRSMDYKT